MFKLSRDWQNYEYLKFVGGIVTRNTDDDNSSLTKVNIPRQQYYLYQALL